MMIESPWHARVSVSDFAADISFIPMLLHVQGHAPRSTELGDLDDGCLLNVLSFLTPLPDLFRMAAVSKVRLSLSRHLRMQLLIQRLLVILLLPCMHTCSSWTYMFLGCSVAFAILRLASYMVSIHAFAVYRPSCVTRCHAATWQKHPFLSV